MYVYIHTRMCHMINITRVTRTAHPSLISSILYIHIYIYIYIHVCIYTHTYVSHDKYHVSDTHSTP